jgi:hypothetical protein
LIECKRVSDVTLTFLQTAPSPEVESGVFASTVFIPLRSDLHWKAGRGRWNLSAVSGEVKYCVSSRDARRRLLEEDAGLVARAAEALARSIADTQSADEGWGERLAVVGAVVTTAQLFVVHYLPSSVGLADGKIEKKHLISHEEVPWVRFTKAFFSPWNPSDTPERTVFIVAAPHLAQFLGALSA